MSLWLAGWLSLPLCSLQMSMAVNIQYTGALAERRHALQFPPSSRSHSPPLAQSAVTAEPGVSVHHRLLSRALSTSRSPSFIKTTRGKSTWEAFGRLLFHLKYCTCTFPGYRETLGVQYVTNNHTKYRNIYTRCTTQVVKFHQVCRESEPPEAHRGVVAQQTTARTPSDLCQVTD